MNVNSIRYVISRIMIAEAIMLVIPLFVTLLYGETAIMAFIIPVILLTVLGHLLGFRSSHNGEIYAREGFIIVALSWIVMSLFGALPFTISGAIPHYVDAFFETVSGFTTTGATILNKIEGIEHGLLFWRSFTHWIGGMGVLVFVMAILPMTGSRDMHIMRAEIPGPEVGKLVSKTNQTAKILYGIYLVLTLTEAILLFAGGMSFFDAVTHSFATAGTGGFSSMDASIGAYNSVYIEMVITVFMLLFGINFNIFYFLLMRRFRTALNNDELKLYLGIVVVSTAAIAVNIMHMCQNFGTALRYSVFQVASIITTTGFSSTDFNAWPNFSKTLIILLMFFGAMAGSTGGGFKHSRILILIKSAKNELKKLIHPHAVMHVVIDKKTVDEKTVHGTYVYFVVYTIVFLTSVTLLAIDPASNDFTTTFSASLSCLNNIGPMISPLPNFSPFSYLSKIMLSLDMLLGRLEIFPILILFLPTMWTQRKTKAKKVKKIKNAE